MKHIVLVKSTVLDWIDQQAEITDKDGNKYTLPLDTVIQVEMIGYPDREKRMLPAYDLATYLDQGYIIEQITYEEDAKNWLAKKMAQAGSSPMTEEDQIFISRTFLNIYTEYTGERISPAEYSALVKQLATFGNGAYREYVDFLVSAAQPSAGTKKDVAGKKQQNSRIPPIQSKDV